MEISTKTLKQLTLIITAGTKIFLASIWHLKITGNCIIFLVICIMYTQILKACNTYSNYYYPTNISVRQI